MNTAETAFVLPESKWIEAIVMGASAGGLNALSIIIPALPGRFALPVIVVQHMPEEQSEPFLATYLNARCTIAVKEAGDKESIRPGAVYIAPAGYHLLIDDDRTFSLSIEEKVNFARPSIDVLFETAADVYQDRLAGVILTRANGDGSLGLRKIKEKGGLTIAQDPETADAQCMPRAAFKTTAVDHVLKLENLGPFLSRLEKLQK